MKVDKAVCTSDTMDDDLAKAIKYDVIFTTLVENKILAIKRECEEKKRARKEKRKSLGRLIFGKRLFKCSGDKNTPNHNVDIEKGESSLIISHVKPEVLQELQVHDGQACAAASHYRFKSEVNDSNVSVKTDSVVENQADDSNGSVENGSLSESLGARNLVVEVQTHRECHSYNNSEKDDGLDIEKGSVAISIDPLKHDSTSLKECVKEPEKDACVIIDDSLATPKGSTESLSFPSSRATVSAVFPAYSVSEKERKRLRILEAKSISAQCSPIMPRQNAPSILTHSICRTPVPLRKQKSHVSYSDKMSNGGGSLGSERKASPQRNLNVSFSRQNTIECSANLSVSNFANEREPPVIAKRKSRKTETRSGNKGERKSKSTSILVVTDKSNRKAINRLDSSSTGSNQSGNLNFMRGLISSFNQLTTLSSATTSNYFPVITTTVSSAVNNSHKNKQPMTISASTPPLDGSHNLHDSTLDDIAAPMDAIIVPSVTVPSDVAKLQRMTSTSTGSSVGPTGCCTSKSASKEKGKVISSSIDIEESHSSSDDENLKSRKKYKRHHRLSDPVLVYPSSGGLQHCILSMPPNQPIQFHYNDDFLYDMTLQVEEDQNGDFQAIVPNHRSRHKHHRHKKRRRHRHKKQKILVHDLDTQSVKVIDPDDLPQRARWTIIATACLLLLMCLLLVGITLRMAPIIDDMAWGEEADKNNDWIMSQVDSGNVTST